MNYEKATAEVVLFDNCDVITTSGLDGSNTGCNNHGHDTGCPGNHIVCPNGAKA